MLDSFEKRREIVASPEFLIDESVDPFPAKKIEEIAREGVARVCASEAEKDVVLPAGRI